MATVPGIGLPPIPANISHLTAPLLVGGLLNYALFGVLCVQVYIYHISFPNDKRGIKLLVFGVFLLELLQVCLSAADIYHWFGSGYGNMNALMSTHLSSFDTPMIGSITSFIVQIFFCYRIWVLRRSFWPLCVLITCISITQLFGGIAGGVRGYLNKTFLMAYVHIEDAYLWLIGNAVADLLIAVTMTILLLKARKREHRFTNDVVMRLVRLVMETNSLTAGIAILSVILFVSFQDANYFICPTLVIGKLYSNTLLVTFNNRIYLNNHHNNHQEISTLGAAPGPTGVSHPRSITLNATRSYGTDSYKTEPITVDHDVELAMHTRTDSRSKNMADSNAF